MPLTDKDLCQLEQLYYEARFPELEERASDLTTQYPTVGLTWSILGAALAGQGKPALEAFAKAAYLLPQDAQAQLQHADTLLSVGQIEAAVSVYQCAVELQPGWAVAHNNLGNASKAAGQLADARNHYESALRCDPKFALAHYNIAILNRDENHWEGVEPALREALDADPSLAPAWVELASVARAVGDLAHAERHLVKAVELAPGLMQARINLAAILLVQNSAAAALRVSQDTIALEPSSGACHLQLGLALHASGRTFEARASIEHALCLQEDLIDGYRILADLACEEGRIEDAIALLERSLKYDGTNVAARSTLLFYRSQVPNGSAQDLFAGHVAFGNLLDEKFCQCRPPTIESSHRSEGRLRVGLVSGDFNNHIVGRALLPVLVHLAARDDIELVAYCNSFEADDWTHKLKQLFVSWHVVVGMASLPLAQRIRADEVDVLIDLAGHTPMNCLEVFSLRAAPVQVSWLGYTWTTGVPQVDYYFADQWWLPPGGFEHLFIERLVYLSAFLPFEFLGASPAVNELPSGAGAPFTFASFNHPRKLSSRVVDAWIGILSRVQGSRLLLGAIDCGPIKDRILAACAKAGLAQERLLFFPRCLPYDYLKLHHKVDVCLDAFPYPSATTIQHAMWMGVPTVTLAGSTPVSRAGAAVLLHVGLREYIAESLDDYMDRAIRAAQRSEELARLRAELRQRLTNSAQCQTHSIAKSLHTALQSMWATHMQGTPARSFVA